MPATREITLRLTIRLESDDARNLTVEIEPTERATSPLIHGRVLPAIEDGAPEPFATYEAQYVTRVADELQIAASPPDRHVIDYINLTPTARRYGTKRISSFFISSGRLAVYCDPKYAADHPGAEVVEYSGEPNHVKIYLNSPEAVDVAVALTRIALEERTAG